MGGIFSGSFSGFEYAVSGRVSVSFLTMLGLGTRVCYLPGVVGRLSCLIFYFVCVSAVRAGEFCFNMVGEGERCVSVGPPLGAFAACEVVDVFDCVLVVFLHSSPRKLRRIGCVNILNKIFRKPRFIRRIRLYPT